MHAQPMKGSCFSGFSDATVRIHLIGLLSSPIQTHFPKELRQDGRGVCIVRTILHLKAHQNS